LGYSLLVSACISVFTYVGALMFDSRNHQIKQFEQELERGKLYGQVSGVVDTDQNGTTRDEWKPVYEFSGVRYDAFASDPWRDLRVEHLQRYLDAHK